MRWWRWCDSYRRISCPKGHHIPNKSEIFVESNGAIRCSKWVEADRAECGAWLYILAIRGDGVIVCEVTLEDMAKIRNMDTPTAIISYLKFFDKPAEGAA